MNRRISVRTNIRSLPKVKHGEENANFRKPIRIEEDAIRCRGRWKHRCFYDFTEHHAFRDTSIMVWARILLGYRTDLRIFKRGSVTAVRYRDEVIESVVRLYDAAVGPTFVLMADNALGRAVSSRFPPPVTLIELETALQEE
ncbi:transposable element Tcb1 transposase [Trichonephila clavipes]|nr:transposable element Tcb1 transposase [Trichonephila clavipes]